jgi:C-terminal processing protease CtpA/Prc
VLPDPPRRWPFTLVDTSDGLVIDVLPESGEATEALRRGDILLAVDGVPVEQLLARAMESTVASTDGSRRARALGALLKTADESLTFSVARDDVRHDLGLGTLPSGADPAAVARPPREFSWRRLEDGIGYLRIPTFTAPDAEAWNEATPEQRPDVIAPLTAKIRQAFAELADTRALILDLRGNTGGTDLLGMEVTRHLLPPGSTYFWLSAQAPGGRWRRPFPNGPPEGPDVPRYEGRLVVLIDDHTFSTSDNLCAALADSHPEVTFVGRPTGAGTGAPRAITRPRTGARVWACTMRVYSPDGTLTEGRGVAPDVPVRWSRADLLEEHDPDLQAALAVLAEAR